ncbi:myosin-2 heavy chain-like [Clarias magur]|uniref:Myosin-2 heavy chain-like n=1 Tax=Clarias magur TaxID=1594786 RepID=A0A8J4US58_CLAMG|nr:myosin-2 heavy chain-like [Clarias magur]
MKSMEKELEKAHESYNEAMHSLPNGWEMIGMDFVAGMTESLTILLNGVTSMVTQPVNLACKASTTISTAISDIKGKISNVDLVDLINIYSKSAEILKCTENVQKFVEDNTINWKDLYDQKNKAAVTYFQQSQFKRIKESFQKIPNCNAKEDAQNICEEGIAICGELAKYAPKGTCEDAKTKELIERIRKLTHSARSFDSKSKDKTKSSALNPTPPMMNKEENKTEKMSASQRASDNANSVSSRAVLNWTRPERPMRRV